jgi:site-specific DNA-methyltransferase (adenine-specific)
MSKHDKGVLSYADSGALLSQTLPRIVQHAFRCLVPHRFAVFFFGFRFYRELVDNLEAAGFTVNPVPVIWYKHTRSTENPNTRYANAYDAALVAMKGSPVLIRPGQTNVVDIPAIKPSERMQIAQQPVELVKRFILDTCSIGATVVDFCAGSGTTGVAALELGCRVILFEKDPVMCELIKGRLHKVAQP